MKIREARKVDRDIRLEIEIELRLDFDNQSKVH